ncbi:SafA/ExsA family spore coat assembly protein [Alkaliphilus peptidifermentans]|uniref:Spore coat assembly protein SafA n=1 Tax=Alkaliphilus peptidifermentans DSM 18978 TaxID=1120976 RepID=A0A1G5EL74_9FIRM|nr:SafA/ExsA family spore coat assembly protein [Alkaliphilus peptidifermentans]SCY27430.1 spore coat assembly protein SafA [Alkaliphilus peptidifermentans DSM 18978]
MYYNYSNQITPPPVDLPPPPACVGGTIYTVRPGDTMFRIANEYGISLQQLIQANPQVTNPNIITPGQRLCVPTEISPPPLPEFCKDGTIYIVQRGDSMFNIARRFGVTLQRLIAANPQIPDPNVLEIGQRICVPLPDLPLPENICRAELRPLVAGVIGGTAFINEATPTLWITTFGLPAPAMVDPKYCVYVAWVYNPIADRYVQTKLQPTGVLGIEAGYSTFPDLITFEGFREIIVTAEPKTIPTRPSGTVLLSGTIIC